MQWKEGGIVLFTPAPRLFPLNRIYESVRDTNCVGRNSKRVKLALNGMINSLNRAREWEGVLLTALLQ